MARCYLFQPVNLAILDHLNLLVERTVDLTPDNSRMKNVTWAWRRLVSGNGSTHSAMCLSLVILVPETVRDNMASQVCGLLSPLASTILGQGNESRVRF